MRFNADYDLSVLGLAHISLTYNFAHEEEHFPHEEVGVSLHHLLRGLSDATNLQVIIACMTF